MSDTIPVTPTGGGAPKPKPVKRPTTGGSGADTNNGSKSGSGMSSAESRAVARENAAKAKAGQKYLTQANNLDIQAKALLRALNKTFAMSRNTSLANVGQRLTESLGLLKQGAAERGAEFDKSAQDTDAAAAGQENQSLSNMVRERADAMSMLLEQGMGETDSMRALLMSARNMNQNQNEGNRSRLDSMRSINAGITDLNVDTRTALTTTFGEAEAERGRIWENFYSRRSQGYTQLGNIRGQQADYYASATEMGVSPGKKKEAATRAGMKNAYEAATTETGKAYKEKANPAWIRDWQGSKTKDTKVQNTNLAAAITIDAPEKADGASLRRWEG